VVYAASQRESNRKWSSTSVWLKGYSLCMKMG